MKKALYLTAAVIFIPLFMWYYQFVIKLLLNTGNNTIRTVDIVSTHHYTHSRYVCKNVLYLGKNLNVTIV